MQKKFVWPFEGVWDELGHNFSICVRMITPPFYHLGMKIVKKIELVSAVEEATQYASRHLATYAPVDITCQTC